MPNKTSPEDMAQLLQMFQAAQASHPAPAPVVAPAPASNALLRYQTVIIFVITALVGLGGWLVTTSISGTNTMTNLQRDVLDLKMQAVDIGKIKAEQINTNSDVRELKKSVEAITGAMESLTKHIESMANDVRAVGQQVSEMSQANRANELLGRRPGRSTGH